MVELSSSDPALLTPEAKGSFTAKATGSLLVVSGLVPGQQYQAFLHSTPVKVGTLTADSSGTLAVTVPAELEAGDHRVALYNMDGSLAGWQSFSVQPAVTVMGAPAASVQTAAETLPNTGVTPAQLLVAAAGVLMVLSGAAALYSLRLRSRQQPEPVQAAGA
ncbi:MAG: LPXTG cell wall anchor domain-containing protein [Arthrobacter sp.]